MKTFIFGASGHAKELFWMISDINKSGTAFFDVANFVVADNDENLGKSYDSVEIVSEEYYFQNFSDETHNCILAIGSSKIRKKIFENIKSEYTQFPSIIHPSLVMNREKINVGKGAVIMPNITITTDAEIADFVHVNIGSTISHDAKIGAFSTISPGVRIAGNVSVGENVFFGINASVIDKIKICNDAVIGAGAVVTKNIDEVGTYVGVPAKKIK